TPADPEGSNTEGPAGSSAAGAKYYQLTHDYLVPALRDWLTRKQKETRKGRAELRLAERAAAWDAKPSNRLLPARGEGVNIRLFTHSRNWTPAERKMMQRAGLYHGGRGLMLALLFGLATWGVWQFRAQSKADRLLDLLLNAKIVNVPDITASMEPYRAW